MRRQLIIGKLGNSDSYDVQSSEDELKIELPLLNNDAQLNFGVAEVIKELHRLNIYPSELGLDLVVLATHVYAADTRISRAGRSQDNWTREISIVVPVSDVSIWNQTKSSFEKLLNFLTGDLWTVLFRSRPDSLAKITPEKAAETERPLYNKVQLFSGGLDSLIGAIDNLEKGNSPLFISHASDGATSDAQNSCFEVLKDHYKEQVFERLRLWMSIPSDFVSKNEVENTTRGRSFLFFSLGIFAGTGLSQPFFLEAPENGLIALNVPLDMLRLGSLSTHTTHPFYMNLWNQILASLNISGTIENLYWKQTKGEMVEACQNPALLQKSIPETLSCSSPSKGRWKGLGIQHCGYCLPCLIRRASIKKVSSIDDNSIYTLHDLTAQQIDTLQSEGQQIRSFQLAIDRIKKRPELASLLIHKSGPLSQDSLKLNEFSDVYLRGLLEVDNLLQNVITKPKY